MITWLPAPIDRAFLRAFRQGVQALAEGLYPEGEPGVPGFRETELTARTEAYVRRLPPSQAPLVALLFVAVDWLTPLLSPFGGRMSRRSPEARVALVESWRMSRFWVLRVVGNAVKASLSMVYFSHPAVFEATGEPMQGELLVGA